MDTVLRLFKRILIGITLLVISFILAILIKVIIILIISVSPAIGSKEDIIVFISKLTNSTILVFLPSILLSFVCSIYLNKFEEKTYELIKFETNKIIITGLLALSMISIIILIDVLIFRSSIIANKAEWKIGILLIVFLFQSIGEELLFRSVLYEELKANFSKFFLLLISSLLFILLHLGYPNFGLIPAVYLFI
ncbi:CPBP family glutamic-type intramembrane protease [Facklamia miroungae]|uniref:CAAX protease self-immunity n=1 Tax=Facklamia miroungae TaxID=120956 RepID=A0A1G7RHF9_9LACT|nr:CPBP family glutamic-type intramembrane protease [Facklamia miroungae]NKZ29433.1 CPBP family intramembrane metalloprotease [Facklamia miroungae]SDG09490.1 CAAX protease self-immunity [Facklamia miroungae]